MPDLPEPLSYQYDHYWGSSFYAVQADVADQQRARIMRIVEDMKKLDQEFAEEVEQREKRSMLGKLFK